MKVPFLGQAYQSRSPILSSQSAINVFPETTEGNSDEIGAFIGTPGLSTVVTKSGAVRGMREAGGYLWAVVGNTVWRIDSAYTATSVGTLPNSTGPVSMVHNPTQLSIAHQDGWHWIALTGTAIAAVAGAPTGSILTYQDFYGIYTQNSGGIWGLTNLSDLSTFNALSVADTEGAPDNLVSVISLAREVVLLGEETTEIWANTGAATFPFERVPGGFVEQGCCAKWSPAKLDHGVFWLGRDRAGRGVVYRNQGYTPVRISTHALEYAINQYSDISDAIGWGYQEEGHSFYELTFPTGDATWVYDVATKGWHRRAWMDTNGDLHRHRANCYATFNGLHFVGDWQNGKIYRQSLDVYTDAGDEIYRERAFDLPDSEQKKVRVDSFEVRSLLGDGDPTASGGPIEIWLSVSRDAGRNFGYQRIVSTGAVGKTMARSRWRRLGTGRNLVLKVGTSMANRVHWVSAAMNAEALDQ
jgi:hypothetical protein